MSEDKKVRPPPVPIKSTSEVGEGKEVYAMAMVFGAPGIGKTHFAATWPSPFFVDIDKGLEVVVNNPHFTKVHGKKDIPFSNPSDTLDEYGIPQKDSDAKGFWEVKQAIEWAANNPEVKTIVIDSITALQDMTSILGMVEAGMRGRSATMANFRSKGGAKVLVPDMGDYNFEGEAIKQLMEQLGRLSERGKHVIVIAHEDDVYGDKGAVIGKEPHLTGRKTRSRYGRWFGDVWRMGLNGKKRFLYTEVAGAGLALKGVKSRAGMPKIEDPTFDKVAAAMKQCNINLAGSSNE